MKKTKFKSQKKELSGQTLFMPYPMQENI